MKNDGGEAGAVEFTTPERPSDRVLIALADTTRRTIFEHLSQAKEAAVSSLAARLGITRQAVLKHLGVLEHAGLVTCLRGSGRGQPNYYRAQPLGVVPLIGWLVSWLAAGAGYDEGESERLAGKATERPPQENAQRLARYRERKLVQRLATMSPGAAAVLLAEHERRKRAWAKRRRREPANRPETVR